MSEFSDKRKAVKMYEKSLGTLAAQRWAQLGLVPNRRLRRLVKVTAQGTVALFSDLELHGYGPDSREAQVAIAAEQKKQRGE